MGASASDSSDAAGRSESAPIIARRADGKWSRPGPVGRARGQRQEQECEGDREQDSERRQDGRESPAVDPLAHEGALGHEGHFLLVAAPLRAGEHLG